jgi:Ser/Thr protein kinase RdoA (MazF antagonist)
MTAGPLDVAVRAVLGRFGLNPGAGGLLPLGNHGGFSGARLWHMEERAGLYCLRAWPPNFLTSERLDFIHGLMRAARQAGLTFVPAVFSTRAGTTWVEQAGRLWDLTSWLAGRADFHDHPTLSRLEAACTALAQLHTAWSRGKASRGVCPALQRRLAGAREWTALLTSGWRPAFTLRDLQPVHPGAERAWRLLPDQVEQIPRRLAPWRNREFPLQPCLCDLWHDHVLFEGPRVTGIVDYGSIKMDHVTVDLARLLGSLVPDDRGRQEAGLAAYTRLRPLTDEETALVAALMETGTCLAAVNWLKWLYLERRTFDDLGAVAARLAALVRRLEGEQGMSHDK